MFLGKCPGGGVLARFYRSGGIGVLNFPFARGLENSPIKNCPGVLPGGFARGMFRLGID